MGNCFSKKSNIDSKKTIDTERKTAILHKQQSEPTKTVLLSACEPTSKDVDGNEKNEFKHPLLSNGSDIANNSQTSNQKVSAEYLRDKSNSNVPETPTNGNGHCEASASASKQSSVPIPATPTPTPTPTQTQSPRKHVHLAADGYLPIPKSFQLWFSPDNAHRDIRKLFQIIRKVGMVSLETLYIVFISKSMWRSNKSKYIQFNNNNKKYLQI
ncbi:hypothetical protein RFI_09501 [Reticulomyxa filosa]|uniref:Uncharacterized protein n=1 Tax=Reticulomyxa filosa TaxID=46433 RepID=X6NNP3_RETFI|nr:hypothetical protein RFI_09501 [Reticulomyxa filosa]|eukprot:ETO27631.1 hypothetical protein RFI_09501 [Reticulomyxa filosa]